MRFTQGWVKLNREDHELMGSDYALRGLWSTLLCMASRGEVKVLMDSKLQVFPPGSVVTSLPELAHSSQPRVLSKIRRDLKVLESLGLIEQKTAGEGRVIRVVNWETEELRDSEKTPENSSENSQKMRQTNGRQSEDDRQANDRPQGGLSVGIEIGKIDENFSATDKRQTIDSQSTGKRQPIGEREQERQFIKTNTGETFFENQTCETKEPRLQEITSKESSGVNPPSVASPKGSSQNDDSLKLEKQQKRTENIIPIGSHSKFSPSGKVGLRAVVASTTADVQASKLAECPLLEVWNQNCGKLAKARLTPSRKKLATKRLQEEPELEYWVKVVRTLAASDFCNGRTASGTWRADFDFLLKEDTHVKASEAKYGPFLDGNTQGGLNSGDTSEQLQTKQREAEENQREIEATKAESRRWFALFDAEFSTPAAKQEAIEKYGKGAPFPKLKHGYAVVAWYRDVYTQPSKSGVAV